MKLRFFLFCCFYFPLGGFASDTTADPYCSLGPAANFASFTLENTEVRHSDISGRAAVGWDLIVNHFAVGCAAYHGHKAYSLEPLPATVSRRVTMSYPSGEIFYPEVPAYVSLPSAQSFAIFVYNRLYRGLGTTCGTWAAFTEKLYHPKVPHVPTDELGHDHGKNLSRALFLDPKGTVDYIANYRADMIDFRKAGEFLRKRAHFYGERETNGKLEETEDPSLTYTLPEEASDVEAKHGGLIGVRMVRRLTLTGTDPQLNTFRVGSDALLRARALEIRMPEGATALINVTGTEIFFARIEIQPGLRGRAEREKFARRVLWNFPEATSLTTISYESRKPFIANELLGTFLAPRADIALAKRFTVYRGRCRHLHWFGSLIVGGVIGKSLRIAGLSDYNTKDSTDADAQACDVVETRGNGQINQVSFGGILPLEDGASQQSCGGPGQKP